MLGNSGCEIERKGHNNVTTEFEEEFAEAAKQVSRRDISGM